jgi:hypothetical protein
LAGGHGFFLTPSISDERSEPVSIKVFNLPLKKYHFDHCLNPVNTLARGIWISFFPLKQAYVMKPFLPFQGSRVCFFSDLFTGDSCPLRIPFDRLRAAVSPIPKSRKERRPPASLFRKNFMALPGQENYEWVRQCNALHLSNKQGPGQLRS